MITESNSIIKIKSFLSGKFIFNVETKKHIKNISLKIRFGSETVYVNSVILDGDKAAICGRIVDPALWNTDTPNLYYFTMVITYADSIETVDSYFAFRTLTIKDNKVFLNNKQVFLKGYIRGAAAHEHKNNYNLTEREFYIKNITAAKKFGFNLVRFHSVVPSECFFNVADELGLLVHIEMRPEFDEYNNLEEMIKGKKLNVNDDYIINIINQNFNHPSLAVYCLGNELKGLCSDGRVKHLGKLVKKLDPSRFYIDTCAWGAFDRKNVDINVQHMGYYFPFATHSGMFENTDNLLVCNNAKGKQLVKRGRRSSANYHVSFSTPLLAHEICHYTALRDFVGLKRKFAENNTPCPWWIEEELKIIKNKHFDTIYEKMFQASKFFQTLCWKICLEEVRLSNILQGFHFLQLADTDKYENSNGFIDCFDDINAVSPEVVKSFNGDEIVIAKLPKRLFFNGDKFSFTVFASLYGSIDRNKCKLNYRLMNQNGKAVAYGELSDINISKRGVYQICDISIDLPRSEKNHKYDLHISLIEKNQIICSNQWSIWTFADNTIGTYNEFVHTAGKDYIITDDIEKALVYLQKGYKVCLVYRSDFTRHLLNKNMVSPKFAFKATWNRFKPVIWDRGTNYGGFCNERLLNMFGFNTGEFYDLNYSVLSEDCDKIVLDDFPVHVESLITGIDKSTRDRFDAYSYCFNLPEILPDRCWRHFSYLFEVCVGKGKLLVCGLNLTGLDSHEPSTVSMANFILKYIKSKNFEPKNHIPFNDFYEYLLVSAKCPVKERMMTQFWQLDDTPVESAQYWIDSKKYLLSDEQ